MDISDDNLLNVLVEYYIVRKNISKNSTRLDAFYKFYGFEDGKCTTDLLIDFAKTYSDDIPFDASNVTPFLKAGLNKKTTVENGLGPAMYMFLKCVNPDSIFITSLTTALNNQMGTINEGDKIKPFMYSYLNSLPDTPQSEVKEQLLTLLQNDKIDDTDWYHLKKLVKIGLNTADVEHLKKLNE